MGNGNKNLIGVGLLAFAFFIALGMVWSRYDEMRALNAAIADRELLVQERKTLVARVKKLNSDYQLAIGDARKFGAVIPTKKEVDELVSAFESMAQRSGVQLGETGIVEDKAAAEKVGARVLIINIKGKGPYEGIRTFMGDLEKNVRLIDLTSVDFAAEEQSILLNFDIKAQAYFIQ